MIELYIQFLAANDRFHSHKGKIITETQRQKVAKELLKLINKGVNNPVENLPK